MKLSVYDRLILLNVLPAEGDITTLRIIRDLSKELGFSDKEYQKLSIRQEGGTVQWDTTVESDKDIEIGVTGSALLLDVLQKMSDGETLSLSQLDIYERLEAANTEK